MKLFDTTLTKLEAALDARLLRQNVLAGNLANANTPHFQPRDIDFARAMEAAQANTAAASSVPAAPGHIDLGADGASQRSLEAAGVIVDAPGSAAGLDGNGVDLDRAMVALSQNGILYGAAAKATNKKLSILRYVASDGAA